MVRSQSQHPIGSFTASGVAEAALPIAPQSVALAAQLSLISLQKKNERQQRLDAERTLERAHIKAQNACTSIAQRNQVKLAWNEHGAGIISEAQMLAIFAAAEAPQGTK